MVHIIHICSNTNNNFDFYVYGLLGKPDAALFNLLEQFLMESQFDVYNHGEMSRDFTYIDDLVDGMRLLIDAVPENWEKANQGYNTHESISPVAPFRVLTLVF